MTETLTLESVKEHIRNVPDFPIPGIQFKDITTVLQKPELFSFVADTIAEHYQHKGITKVVCIESRGFILGGAVAHKLGAGFVPIRKPGKLPAETYAKDYQLEYGTDSIEIHKDAITSSDRILLHDDLLATGGTANAAIDLLKVFNPVAIYPCFFIELGFLNGRKYLGNYEVTSLIHF